MTAEEYLRQIKVMELKISEKEEQTQSIRETIETVRAVSYAGVKVKTTPKEHISDSVSRLEKAERELMSSAADLAEKKTEIMQRIHRISRPEYVELLYLRYVETMRWEAIAEKMSYSVQHIFKLHRRALSVFTKTNKDLFFCKNPESDC